jgi:hypothetical protein
MDIAPDLATLINGVSISIRQNLHVDFRSSIAMTHTHTLTLIACRVTFSFLLSIWIKPQLKSFFESTDGIKMIRQLGIDLKTDILGHPIGQSLTDGNPSYTTEVEFQRHIRGKSQKALRKTKIIID